MEALSRKAEREQKEAEKRSKGKGRRGTPKRYDVDKQFDKLKQKGLPVVQS